MTRSLMTYICGKGVIMVGLDVSEFIGLRHATVLVPSMFIEQDPHIPSLHDLR